MLPLQDATKSASTSLMGRVGVQLSRVCETHVKPNGEFIALFEKAGLSKEDCELVAERFELGDVKRFYEFFEPPEDNVNFKA